MYTISSNIGLYAIWGTKLTYNANGGTGAPSDPAVYYAGENAAISGTQPTKANYIFLGWSTDENATTAEYEYGDSVTLAQNTTLYAVWKANTYTISYIDHENNTITPSGLQTSYTYGVGATIGDAEPYSRTGYTFLGWYDAATGGSKVTTVSTTDTGDKTLYARWEVNTYNITYENLNGAANSTNPAAYTYGTGVTSFVDPGTRTGYTFAGWYDAATK